ncbi:hypothetical protein GLOIN_2v1772564 [Rhizophagus clarus]|uniref:Uncharacterized protein n=1 Tax=Rhizophagus clarus TaxID=94130 RepID=A0A8H3LMD6_9GLOM|nr:hypothetical protein GLOIN_2v1772564 [Rhizophagus clarus]
MSSKKPSERAYILGLCYLCQACLRCNKSCDYQTCKCKNKEKTPLNKKKNLKKKFYAQTYQPIVGKKSFNSSQINELKSINNYYGYNTNFSEEFDFSTCTKCHAKFWRLGKENVKQNESEKTQEDTSQFSSSHVDELEEIQVNSNQTSSSYESEKNQLDSNVSESPNSLTQDDSPTPTFTSSDDDENGNSTCEIEFIEITFKLIIKAADGKCNAAKWETIIADNFQGFINKLDRLVQEQFEDQIVFRGDYNVAYKQEKEAGQGTQLTNSVDWERFLKENERIISQKKVLIILITMKRKSKKIGLRNSDNKIENPTENVINKKNKSSNQIPKKKNIDSTDAIIAQNIMELHSRWHCKEHDRSCYVDSTRHISLTTNHLSTWARSIQHNLATLDDPLTLPLFNAANNTKKKKCQN